MNHGGGRACGQQHIGGNIHGDKIGDDLHERAGGTHLHQKRRAGTRKGIPICVGLIHGPLLDPFGRL
jgi:hypothetical protein